MEALDDSVSTNDANRFSVCMASSISCIDDDVNRFEYEIEERPTKVDGTIGSGVSSSIAIYIVFIHETKSIRISIQMCVRI